MKSVTLFKNVIKMLNLGQLETIKSNFKNFCWNWLKIKIYDLQDSYINGMCSVSMDPLSP